MTMMAAASTAERVSRASSWVPVAAWGLGLVDIALGAAALVGVQADGLSRALGVLAVVQGVAALAWGAASLALGRTPLPRAAVAGAAAAVAIAVALLATAPGRAGILAIMAATGLGVAVACGIVRGTRRPSRRTSLWSLMAAAAVVTLVVVPALGACQGAALLDADGTVLPVVTHEGH
ncbi:hypothetical protein Q9R08_11030 [Microbacterium sp. QXD-8]|uniref:Uncharacterized protein n=1 Tax=Microbacterium psychrotolerans TaxID=3068321 RepID=A0ABU0Z1Q8_9MICO|nr:hypothetical protein [Microbacterium sp. QXD-8]MDQ7878509.1 hypothetical protein [Microbacterium sp. QXD-8]